MKQWILKEQPDEAALTPIITQFGLHPTTSALLWQRGIRSEEEVRKFLHPSLDQLHPPEEMLMMKTAVDCVQHHLQNDSKIMIYGDYDVDGTTSVALMVSYLQRFSQSISHYIPDREKEGYGVSKKGMKIAQSAGIQLIITLDCGIKSVDLLSETQAQGIDVIICDHHLPGEEVPLVSAILNPKLVGCNYPYKELSGCGVGFKLIHALENARGGSIENILEYLDLVAVSIGADLVPMTGENRILAHAGIQRLNTELRIGLKPFVGELKQITIEDIVFKIAPRINAAGRLAHARRAVDLLISTSESEAVEFAEVLETYNSERKLLDSSITEKAIIQTQENIVQGYEYTNVVYHPQWHKGVVGIVASRLIEQHYRPTLVLTESKGVLAGSARSIPGLNMYAALDACKEYLIQFGGHYFAAGMTLHKEHLSPFKEALESYVRTQLTEEDLVEKIHIDLPMELDSISPKFLEEIPLLEPFGPEHQSPVFGAKYIQETGYSRVVGKGGEHLSLSLRSSRNTSSRWKGIAFRQGNVFSEYAQANQIAIVYHLQENHWKEKKDWQLQVLDIKLD